LAGLPYHTHHNLDLAPSDFHLFRKIKAGLCGQHFPDDAIIAAVRKWVPSTGADFYESIMKALVHRWQKFRANGGDYVE
jgi:hypothetical protein